MATPQIILDINDKNEVVRIHGINASRRTVLAKIDAENATLYWKSTDTRDSYHKSVLPYLENEKVPIKLILMEGQKPDVIPAGAPPCPEMHSMQGDLTPAYLDWLKQYSPIKFQNTLGVELRRLDPGEKEPADPRKMWLRSDVIRTDSRPKPGTRGGEYVSTRFIQRDQIIARRASHCTFTKKEILKQERDVDGNLVEATAPPPYEDRYNPDILERMEKRGDIEVVWRRAAAASSTSNF